MANIAIVRHGQARHNIDRVYSSKTAAEGGDDHPLIPGQEETARSIASMLQENGFANAAIWCSPLQRTRDTARLLTENGLQGRVTILEELRETDAGALDGQPLPDDAGLSLDEQFNLHATHAKKAGGESFEDVLQRIQPICEMLKALPSQEKIICITHGTPARALLKSITKLDLCLEQWGVLFLSSDDYNSQS